MKHNTTTYNEKKYFNQEIKPLMEEIKRKCNYRNIPLFMTACVSCDENGNAEYETDILSPEYLDVSLPDKRFVEFIKVMNGFVTEIPSKLEEITLN